MSSQIPSSFRDPNGFLFEEKNELFRQVNLEYQDNYDLLNTSGLYAALVKDGLLIAHEEVDHPAPVAEKAYKILKPERLGFISYPYEWSFSQLKDAAFLTLTLQKRAIEHGMILKDSSAYNVQFHPATGKPIFIDTLSFEAYVEGEPWVAYKQFCQHFLAPLALMKHKDIRLGLLLREFIDGVPLDLASKLLPFLTRLNSGLLIHIHLHATAQKSFSDKTVEIKNVRQSVSKISLLGLIDSLERTINKLTWNPGGTEWGAYYDQTNYSTDSFGQKAEIVRLYLDEIQPESVWDLGGNTGVFSRLASEKEINTVSFDIDPTAVEINYLQTKKEKGGHLIPLILDLTNPSPSIGWAHDERASLKERGPVDTILALALIHHLAISNNLPLEKVAQYFSHMGGSLIIEFVPKSDSQVKKLLTTRKDIFPDYTIDGFEAAFGQYYKIIKSENIEGSDRTMFLMKKK